MFRQEFDCNIMLDHWLEVTSILFLTRQTIPSIVFIFTAESQG
jgi:hypothetical protein